MIRSIIWLQVALAVLSLMASLTDRWLLPRIFMPALLVAAYVALFSLYILPPAVIILGVRQQSAGGEQARQVIATLLLAIATVYLLLPLCQ